MAKSKVLQSAEYKALKAEVSRMASLANKRLRRLESHGLEDTPAYKHWIEQGGEKFSVRGKDYNALQKELARVRQFTESKTSTIRGAQKVLQEIAANTGANITGKQLWAQASNFFRIASQVEQYLRLTEQSASAIGYQKIWQAINTYVEQENIDLSGIDTDLESMVDGIAQMIGYETLAEVDEAFLNSLPSGFVEI